MFDAVIFDWDGTLADTRRVILISFHKALELINYKVTDEYVERRIGIGAAETFREILHNANLPVDEAVVKRLVQRKSEVQVELSSEVKLFSGACELLTVLQGKVKVGLASMNNSAVITSLLQRNDITECFEKIVTAESVSRSKPDPEIFLKAATQLNAIPARCVVLEDSIFGVRAAKAAGMSCIAVTTGVYNAEELKVEKPDLVVKSLKDPQISSFILQ